MRMNPNLPEPTLFANSLWLSVKNTLELVGGILKLVKKIFML